MAREILGGHAPKVAMDLDGSGRRGNIRRARTPHMHVFASFSQTLGHLRGVVADASGLRRVFRRDDVTLHAKDFAPGFR